MDTATHIETSARVEFFSLEQSADVLSLLRFPVGPLLPKGARIKASLRAMAKTRSFTVSSQEELIEKLYDNPFNSLELAYQFEPFPLPELDTRLIRLTQRLEMAPTNELWSLPSSWPDDLKLRRHGEYHTLDGREVAMKNYVARGHVPTHLSAWFTLEDNIEEQYLYRWLPSALAHSIPQDLLKRRVCGGGGLMRIELANDMVVKTLLDANSIGDGLTLKRPETYLSLCERFIVLQPLMIGPYSLCSSLAQALGDRAELIGVPHNTVTPVLGIVRISGEVDDRGYPTDPKINELAAPWIV